MRKVPALLLAAALLPAVVAAETVAITGGRIHTLSPQGVLERGTVLIEDGHIAAVGTDVRVPRGARVIDATGKWVTPGIFDAYSQLGLTEVDGVSSTTDYAADNPAFSAGFDVSRGVNPNSTLVPITRLAGVTRAAIFPVAANSIFAGSGALIHLGEGYEPVFKARAFLAVEMGVRGAKLAGGARGAAWIQLLQAFSEAGTARREAAPGKTLNRMDIESLKPVLSGEIPLAVHVERASDIVEVLGIRKSYPKIRLILIGAAEGWMVADRIAAAETPVILDSYQNLPIDFDRLGATQENAARLARAGVVIAVVPLYRNGSHDARMVAQQAGNAVANGLPWEEGLKAITQNPARIFGVADELGSLEPGKIADVLVWNADPLELGSRPDVIIIAGREMPLVSRQTKLRDRYDDLADPEPLPYRY